MHEVPRLPLWKMFTGDWLLAVQSYLNNSGSAPVFALMIVVFGLARGHLAQLLRLPGMVFLGEVSFALYLVHATVLDWFAQHPQIAHVQYGILCFWGVSLALATLLHVAVERPARKLILGQGRPATAAVAVSI